MKNIILLFVLASLSLSSSRITAQSDHPDYAALEALYNATNGYWWWENTNWLSGEPIATWYGITVDENNRVSEINLDVGLSGTLPNEIGNLEMLKVLNLNWNWELTGNIPETIINLTHLEVLDLRGCTLSGLIPDLSPLNLLTLAIEGNMFQFGDFENEFTYYLENIDHFVYDFQHGEFIEVTGQIGNTVELTTDISGSSNHYAWFKLNEFHEENPLNETNSILTLSNFQNVDSGTYVCKATSDLVPGLEIRWIFDCFSPAKNSPDYEALIAFYHSTGGSDWFYNSNWLNPEIPLNKWFGIDINDNNRVTGLSLTENNLTGTLPPEIGNLEYVEWFFFGRNSITGDIPDELWSIPNLSGVMLFYNQLNGTLSPAIKNARNMFALSLVRNKLTGPIPVEIGELINLEYLELNANDFTGTIPEEIKNASKLRLINLGSNNLEGPIPSGIGQLSELRQFFLYFNNISGNIPPEIGNLQNLEYLEFWSNQLTGTIPEELGNLENIRELGIGNNNLEGNVPTSLQNLKNLSRLDLELNRLRGPLPNLTTQPLEVLFLGSNNFIFSDFEDQFNHFYNTMGGNFYYSPMNPFDEFETINEVSPPKDNIELNTLFYNNSNASANNSYQWYKNQEPMEGATSPNYLIENAIENDTGVYTCMVTNSVVSGLTLERNPYIVNIIDKIPNPTDVVFTMYPNPTNSTFTITSDTVSEGFIEVYNFQGVMSFGDYYSSEYNNHFDVSTLNRGIYIVKLSTFTGETFYNKLIKK